MMYERDFPHSNTVIACDATLMQNCVANRAEQRKRERLSKVCSSFFQRVPDKERPRANVYDVIYFKTRHK